jgi:hypothetical protein
MSWVPITADDLKAAGHSAIVEEAGTLAVGEVDPVTDALTTAVARVRRAVAAANALDTDATLIPRSLKGVAVRLALFALMERIGLPLSEDQRSSRKEDASDLNRLADRKIRVEAPENPDATLSPQIRGGWNSEHKLIGRMHPVPAPALQHGQPGAGYANPDAPSDATE